MTLQIIGFLSGIIGFFTNIYWLLIFGGVLCLFTDLIGFTSGKLRFGFPIILYISGYIITGSWIGIFYGSIIGNSIEAIPIMIAFIISITKKK